MPEERKINTKVKASNNNWTLYENLVDDPEKGPSVYYSLGLKRIISRGKGENISKESTISFGADAWADLRKLIGEAERI